MVMLGGETVGGWPGGISAITLFVEDLAGTKQFYLDVFDLPVLFEDEHSVVFNFGNTLVNLLHTSAAPELIEPALVAPRRRAPSCNSPSRWLTWTPGARNWSRAA